MADFVSGDTGSTLVVNVVDDSENVISLVSALSVKIRWVDEDGVVQEKNMTIDDAAAGKCSYKFVTGELFPGGMGFEVEVTDAGGQTISNVDFINMTVRKALG